MKLAVIPPISHLTFADRFQYQMVLAPLMDDKDYAHHYLGKQMQYKIMILDNGAAEGATVSNLELMDRAYELEKATDAKLEIVVPDVLGDYKATVDLCRKFEASAQPSEHHYIGVVQGSNTHEVVRCLQYYQMCKWIDTIALPRILTDTLGITFRHYLLEYMDTSFMENFFPNGVHLLGSSRYVSEIPLLAAHPRARSMDTSMPFSWAFADRTIIMNDHVPRPEAYFQQELTHEQEFHAWENLNFLIRLTE